MTAKRAPKYPEKSSVINFRITPETKRLLEQAARAHGRTLSSECELQLQRSLSSPENSQTHAIMTLIGLAIDAVTNIQTLDKLAAGRKHKPVQWWNDPYLYVQVEQMVIAALGVLRPRGPLPNIDPRQRDFVLNALVREIQVADPSVPFEKQTPHQRRINRLKQDLGLLADRAAPFGVDADAAREEVASMKPFREELIALTKKNALWSVDWSRCPRKRGESSRKKASSGADDASRQEKTSGIAK